MANATIPAIQINEGKVGIGTTTPTSTLQIDGQVLISATAPFLDFVDTNSFTDVNDRFRVRAGGNEGLIQWYDHSASSLLSIMTFQPNGNVIVPNGNVGIGTTSPSEKLEVYNAQAADDVSGIRNSAYRPHLTLQDLSANANDWQVWADGGVLSFLTGDVSAVNKLTTERMRIDSTGNVGIGTTSPGAKLEINAGGNAAGLKMIGSNTSYTAAFIGNTGTGNAGVYFDASNGDFSGGDYGFIGQHNTGYMQYNIGSDSTAPYHVFTGGNVGIGTTSPGAKLEVNGITRVSGDFAGTGQNPLIQLYNTDTSLGADQILGDIDFYQSDPSGGGAGVVGRIRSINDSSFKGEASLTFFTGESNVSFQERMRINSTGNVGIGTTSPAAKLSIAQPSSGDTTIIVGRRGGKPSIKSDATEGGYLILDSHASAAALNHYSSNNVWLATGGGNVGIGTTSPVAKLEVNTGSNAAYFTRTAGDNGVTSPVVAIASDSSRGLLAASGASLDFRVRAVGTANPLGGSTMMRIQSNGDVGIGDTSPSSRLQVYDSTEGQYMEIGAGDSGGRSLVFTSSNNNGSAGAKHNINAKSINGVISFSTGGNERLLVSKDGNVGIGTTSPGAKLDVNGDYILNNQRGLMVRSIDESNYFSFNDESTTADFEQQLPRTGGSGSVAKADDSTAPAPGCFEITGSYYSDIASVNRYIKIDVNSEYTWEIYVKFVSGTDTDQRIYLGSGMWDANKSYFGNTQRYWGSPGYYVDANSLNDDWHHIKGTIKSVGSNTGNFISGTEYIAPIALLNYGDNANVIRVCGLKLYKSEKSATSLKLNRNSTTNYYDVDAAHPEGRLKIENNGSDILRARNDHGYIEMGSGSSSYAHFNTDRNEFYFNKRISVDSGIISSYNEDLNLRTGTTTALTILNSNQNVGIGTTSPQSPLHIYKSLSGGVGGELRLDNNNNAVANKTRILFSDGGGASGLSDRGAIVCETEASPYMGQLQFQTGVGSISTKMIILGNGNVGIGMTSPGAKLEINGAGKFSGGTVVSGVDTHTDVGVAIAKGNFLKSNDGSYLRNIIGQTSGGVIEIGQGGTALISDINFKPGTSGNINFYGSGSLDMRIASNGNVGIGTTSPGEKLHVAGEVKATGGFTYASGSTTPARESGTTGLQFWSGTKAQYDALTKDSNTIYYVTDE